MIGHTFGSNQACAQVNHHVMQHDGGIDRVGAGFVLQDQAGRALETFLGEHVGIVAIFSRAINAQRQARQRAGLFGAHVTNRHRPVACGLFAPELHAGEVPQQMGGHTAVGTAQANWLLRVHCGPVHQIGYGSAGRGQLDDQVPQARVTQVDAKFHMLY